VVTRMPEQSVTSGQISSIKTLVTGEIRLTIDIQLERVPSDIILWRYKTAAIALLDEDKIEGHEVVKRTGKPVRR
jgi:hypothetical protein